MTLIIRRLLAPLLLCTLAFAQAAAAADPAAAAALTALGNRYYEAQARLDPVYSATLAGDNRFDDQLPITIAPAERKKRFATYHALQRDLAGIARHHLGEREALEYDLLGRELRTRIGFEAFDDHLLPLQQMDSIPLLLARFGGGQSEQPLKTVAHYDAYLKRIERLPTWTAQAMINMREGMRRGIVQPRAVVDATLPQIRALASPSLADNPFYAPIRNLPASFAERERERLIAAYRAAVEQRVVPAMRNLVRFLEVDYAPASRTSAGWGALPNGAAWYRQYLRDQTTTDLSPDEIHALGLKEVARIQGELARVAPQLGYTGDPRRLLAWVRENEKFRPFRSDAQVLDAYRAISTKVAARLPELFGRMPKAPLELRAEPELTKATASDHYSLPAEDGSRPGIYWAVINDPLIYNRSTMVGLFLHEGQPGHHLQMALQQEMGLAQFRKRMWVNAFGEGWALYAETLGHELGVYDDPVAYVGELGMEIWRAARLVVDTGMHAKGWSREQAMAYWIETVGASEATAQNQIQRYMAWPAQALGYKLGALKIQQLRERAKQALGERFSIAAFHDAVLGEGSLPLSLLEAHIDRWIARQRQP
jgi:uncharacterized protein (DUF885 family)